MLIFILFIISKVVTPPFLINTYKLTDKLIDPIFFFQAEG